MISVGWTVLYKLTEQDAAEINRRRTTGSSIADRIKTKEWPVGAQAHIGNWHHEGQVLPLVVVVVWPNEFGPEFHGVNGQLLLDGNDTLWKTSVREGTEPGTWTWPVKLEGAPI